MRDTPDTSFSTISKTSYSYSGRQVQFRQLKAPPVLAQLRQIAHHYNSRYIVIHSNLKSNGDKPITFVHKWMHIADADGEVAACFNSD